MEDIEKFPAQWALDCFDENNFPYRPSIFQKYGPEIYCGLAAFMVSPLTNMILNRPLITSLHHQFRFVVMGIAVGRILSITADKAAIKRDAILIDYIKRYPERFPEPSNRKYADVFEEWKAIR